VATEVRDLEGTVSGAEHLILGIPGATLA
jgi:hypothetical protein